MSRGEYTHLHRMDRPGLVEVHDPHGNRRGYIQRVRIQDADGHLLSRSVFVPQDERGMALTDYVDTRYRAIEWVTER